MISRYRRVTSEPGRVKSDVLRRKTDSRNLRQSGAAMTQASFATHEVLNQSPPFEDVDLFTLDRPLSEAVAANGGASAQSELSEFGKHWGSAAMAARGRVANENTPKLRTFDSCGNRRDEVEFHPAYHELMAHSAHAGVHNSTWTAQGKPAGGAAEVVRAAKFYIAAQADEGLTCFFMPRFRPDGSVNAIQFQRLKDKLGNRSNASSEVEFNGAYAERVGDEGKGIRTIIQMVQLTRQDCAIASAGLMRSGLAHALHHARHRSVFQKHLADQPLMQAVLSDMALHVEASIALVMRLCRSFDRAPDDANEAAFMRLLTPAIKYWVCKSAPGFLYEAMECLGGNGYVEEGILARHYRESPVNAIWEGSGNVMCLDVLRALSREADAAGAVLQQLAEQAKGLPGAGEAVMFIANGFRRPDSERVARLAVEKLALLAAAAALNKVSPPQAELFAASRLANEDIRSLLQRALP